MSQPNVPLEQVKEILKQGDLVALPTETVYGLAADGLNPAALQKIFDVKGRPLIDPLILHAHDIEQIKTLAYLSTEALKLVKYFWPGALTLVLRKKEIVPDLATAGLQTVGIRMPKNSIMREVLAFCKFPLAAPSANPFGYISPTEAAHVKKTLGEKVRLIVDGGACEIGIESTILDISNPESPKLLRPGPISKEAIEEVLNKKVEEVSEKNDEQKAQLAPGLLSQHYSPRTPLHFLNKKNPQKASKSLAIIHMKRPLEAGLNDYWLSETGNLHEVAHNLFKLMQLLDGKKFKKIYIEKPPMSDIGVALNDRLKRAVHD